MPTRAESVEARETLQPNVDLNDRPLSFRPSQALGTSAVDRAATNGQLATALGWLSVALGAAQLIAPRQLARAIGVPDNPLLMRSLGFRELANGVAILTSPQIAGPALKARVAGDAIDLALLGSVLMREDRAERPRTVLAALAVAGVTALDAYAARRYDAAAAGHETIVTIRKTIAIDVAPDVLYHAWRDVEELPNIMRHLESATQLADGRSHWVARAPAGMQVEWDAEVIADEPNRLLAWRSIPGSQVDNMGSVRFEPMPGRRGTLLTVELEYRPPAGRLGVNLAKLFGEEPQVQLQEDLRRFKQLMETGEIATTRSQPAGRRSLKYRLMSKKEPANAR